MLHCRVMLHVPLHEPTGVIHFKLYHLLSFTMPNHRLATKYNSDVISGLMIMVLTMPFKLLSI